MEKFNLAGKEYIELNKLLKLLNWVSTGGEANMVIDNGDVSVNGEVETRRRNKLREGSRVDFQSYQVVIEEGGKK